MVTDSSYTLAVVETPSDTATFVHGLCDAIYVGSTGNITVTLQDDNDVLFTAVQVGTVLPVKVKGIKSTGSGSGPFVALYRR